MTTSMSAFAARSTYLTDRIFLVRRNAEIDGLAPEAPDQSRQAQAVGRDDLVRAGSGAGWNSSSPLERMALAAAAAREVLRAP
jgi:hypothetical protein